MFLGSVGGWGIGRGADKRPEWVFPGERLVSAVVGRLDRDLIPRTATLNDSRITARGESL